MPRYFFDFDDDVPEPTAHEDWDGLELADEDAVRQAALAFLPRYAVDRLRSDVDQQVLDLQVRDGGGQSVYRVRLVMQGERPTTNRT